MKPLALLASLLIVAPAWAEPPAAVTVIPHEAVEQALRSKTAGPLFKQPDLVVQGCYRDKPGVVEIHQTLTNIFYITEGEATLVIGGQSQGAKLTSPGQLHGAS